MLRPNGSSSESGRVRRQVGQAPSPATRIDPERQKLAMNRLGFVVLAGDDRLHSFEMAYYLSILTLIVWVLAHGNKKRR